MPLGAVVDERAGGSAEVVVERDAGGEREQPLADAGSQAVQGAGAVAFEREQVFAGPEDALDPLADRGQVRPVAGIAAALACFAVEVAISVAWLSRFRYGPAEWLWRTLTYGRLQPMRALPSANDTADLSSGDTAEAGASASREGARAMTPL